MKFNSVKEYFYKLNNRGYQLMMMPLIIFTFFYSQSIIKLSGLVILNPEISRILFYAMVVLSVIALTIVQTRTKKMANAIAKEVGLGSKLEKLGTVLTRKMVTLSVAVLLMPVALLFTGDGYFGIAFGVFALWYFLQWPTPGRVCRLLYLRGDEKEMVITRGEAFK
jgi:hypothetical protein